MKKIIYITAIIVYTVIAIWGFAGNTYIETGAASKMLDTHGLWIFIVSAIAGIAIAYYFPKAFPKGFAIQKKAGKIVILIIIMLFSFALTLGIFHFYNSHLGKRTIITIDGFIVSRWQKTGRKNSKTYYLGIRDFNSGKLYEFKVKRSVYTQTLITDGNFKKDFYKGSLGVLYRNSN